MVSEIVFRVDYFRQGIFQRFFPGWSALFHIIIKYYTHRGEGYLNVCSHSRFVYHTKYHVTSITLIPFTQRLIMITASLWFECILKVYQWSTYNLSGCSQFTVGFYRRPQFINLDQFAISLISSLFNFLPNPPRFFFRLLVINSSTSSLFSYTITQRQMVAIHQALSLIIYLKLSN